MVREVSLGEDLNLEFEVLELTGSVLRCRYEVENVSGSELYLFNRLYHDLRDDGVFDLDPNLVYVDVENSTLHLSKRIPNLPEGVLAEALIIPCVTVLPSGGRMQETFSLSLPLQRMNPYLRHLSAPVESYESVFFSLGYFRVAEIGRTPVETVRTSAGPALHVNVTAGQQLVVRTAPFKVGAVTAPKEKKCPRCGVALPPESRFCSQCGSPLQ
jgi:hypothetical protein